MGPEWMDILVSLATLTALEVVLGVDNVIFISILTSRLPLERRETARKWGIIMALLLRLILLSLMSWISKLTTPLFYLLGVSFSGKALILFLGGLFLLYKSTKEIHSKLEGEEHQAGQAQVTFSGVLIQVALLDLVFSLDSVITAVGMAQSLWVMVAANLIAMGVMWFSGKAIGDFVHRHPTFKILALSFLMMIGVMLVAEGIGFHIPKGYLYFAMAFSCTVELLNMRLKKRGTPVELHQSRVVD
ncbi:MAG: TerC family protein [Bdellovibrionales bacterium]|nr:TerC family protein [Bdellovibrionales bacterium]